MNSFSDNHHVSLYLYQMRSLREFVLNNSDKIVGTYSSDIKESASKYARKVWKQQQVAKITNDDNMPLELAKLEATLGGYDIGLISGGYNSPDVIKNLCMVINAIIEKYSHQ